MYDDLTFEKLGDGIEVCISTEHRFGTDAFLLANFSQARRKDEVCDLCSGNGIVGLLLMKSFSPKHIYAVEIQNKAFDQLCLSVERSNLTNFTPIHADLKEWRPDRELDLVTCNPPYKINNTGAKNDTEAESIARHEILCNFDDVCKASSKMLKFGGRLCVCNRPERLSDMICAMRKYKLEPKRIRFVSKTPESSPWLVLIEARKGGNPFLQVEPPLFIKGENKSGYSDEMEKIYGINKQQGE